MRLENRGRREISSSKEVEYDISLETHTHLQELNIDVEEVESLLVACILDSTVHGRIDQVNQILELDQEPQGSARCVQSVVT